jgi:hypothetical protein
MVGPQLLPAKLVSVIAEISGLCILTTQPHRAGKTAPRRARLFLVRNVRGSVASRDSSCRRRDCSSRSRAAPNSPRAQVATEGVHQHEGELMSRAEDLLRAF